MTLIRKPSQLLVQEFIKALIYGQPGLGKTTAALSAPSPLLLDFDGGVHRVNPVHQTDTVQISSWDDVIGVLAEDLTAYRTLVIDTAGKMLDFMNAHLIKNDPKLGKADGSLTLQGYGARKVMFINFLKQVSFMKKHLIFVAHDKEEKDGDQKIIRPEIGGSSAGDLIKELDLVGYMEAIGKKRTISFDPCEKFYGKNTCELESRIDISELTPGVQNILMTSVIDRFKNNLERRKAVSVDYEALLDLISNNIGDVQTPKEANEIIEWVESVQHVWDTKLQASRLLRDRVKELGFVFNKDLKAYEAAPKPPKASKPKAEKPEPKSAESLNVAATLPTIPEDAKQHLNGETSKEPAHAEATV